MWRIFPEIRPLMMQLSENRLYWESNYIEELNESTLSLEEKENALQKSSERKENFFLKYHDVFGN